MHARDRQPSEAHGAIGKIPASLLSKLPPAQSYKNVKFPNAAQTAPSRARSTV